MADENATPKMNPRVKALWLDALRSGKYAQGISALRSKGDLFCCLGVLCDLHIKKERTAGWRDLLGYSYLGEENYPPLEVCEWAGLYYRNPPVKSAAGVKVLSDINDNGASFQEIANIIEEQL